MTQEVHTQLFKVLNLDNLRLERGSNSIYCWTGLIPNTKIVFSIILEQENLSLAKLDFIDSILAYHQTYILKAQSEFKKQLSLKNGQFGLTKEQAQALLTKVPVLATEPHFLFYQDFEWILHFQDCVLDSQFGLMIEFLHEHIVKLYSLDKAQLIE